MRFEFTAEVWWWRGPSPFHFVSVPQDECAQIEALSRLVTYGWGMIPVSVQIGETEWTTSLWPKDGGYVVPLKVRVRKAESIELGDQVSISLTIPV